MKYEPNCAPLMSPTWSQRGAQEERDDRDGERERSRDRPGERRA